MAGATMDKPRADFTSSYMTYPPMHPRGEKDGRLELWKSDLSFTGDNPEFPLEIFIAIMEKKYSLSLRRTTLQTTKQKHLKTCFRVLKHIDDDENAPASLWKKHYVKNTPKEDISWATIKKSLTEHFGRMINTASPGSHCYSLYEQIVLLNSLSKGEEEKLSTFCMRVNAVTSILEHGNVCPTRKPSQHWVKLFFLMGLEEEERNLVIQDADTIFRIKDICSLLLERKRKGIHCQEDLDEKQSAILSGFDLHECDNTSVYTDVTSSDIHTANKYSLMLSGIRDTSTPSTRIGHTNDKPSSALENEELAINDAILKEEPCEPQLMVANDYRYDPNIVDLYQNDKLPPMMEDRDIYDGENTEELLRIEQKTNIKEERGDKQPSLNEIMCVICDKLFTSRKQLKMHNQETHPSDQTTKCPHCEFERSDKRSVIIHIQRTHSEHRNEKPFQCHQCSKSYRFNFKLTAHCRLAHGDGGIYKCTECSYKCDQRNRLQEHIDGIHGKTKRFKCDKCDFSTSWRRGLTNHLWVLHGEGKGSVYTCEQCGYTTKVQSLYRNHLMNLHNIGDYKPGLCPICGMTFKTKAYLMDHMYKVHKKTLKGKDTKAAIKESLQHIVAPSP